MPGRDRLSTRRLRFDPRQPPQRWRASGPGPVARRLILLGVAAFAVLWTALFVLVHRWVIERQALARFGALEVAPLVDALADRPPPGVVPADWFRAVAETRTGLIAVAASGRLDRPRLEALRDDVARRVARATPATARAELSRVWDDLEALLPRAPARRDPRGPYPPRRPALLRAGPGR